jgi:hypothetical protein
MTRYTARGILLPGGCRSLIGKLNKKYLLDIVRIRNIFIRNIYQFRYFYKKW